MTEVDRLQLEIQLREASKAEIENRIKAHKLAVDRIRGGIRRRRAHGLVAAKAPLDCLAVGDSWFDYPLDDGFLSIFNHAIVADSQLGVMGNPHPLILNKAIHGQATTAMLSWQNQQLILDLLTDPSQWINGTTADAILVSAGGDDIVGDQFAIYLDYHGGGLNNSRFQGVLASIQASYLDLFALRDIAAAEVGVNPSQIPIFGHCYDYAVPDGRGALVFGPWLKPPLDFDGYDYNMGLTIVEDAINGFHDLLNKFSADIITLPGKKNYFTLIDTRKTLTRDGTWPTGWANEIHPYTAGFTELAKSFLVSLQKHFPNRI
jgi:hypothetical protein